MKPTAIAVIMLVIGVLGGVIIGLNLPSLISSPQVDEEPEALTKVEDVSADDDPFLGSLDAPVTIIEFSDFQCPFCNRFFQNTFPELKKNYIDTGKVRYVYRDFPISSIHPFAEEAAEAANCAGEQGRFWEYHDMLFENQVIWASGNSTVEFKRYASNLSLNEEQFNLCLESERYADEVSKDLQDGLKVGVNGTPTLFVNGFKVVGAQPYEVFKGVIDSELER